MSFSTHSYLSLVTGTILLGFFSCNLFDQQSSFECEYEIFRDGHYLEMPITFEPYSEVYRLGDTLKVNMTFQDSIYDQGTRQTFKVENMKFRPLSLLYRFYDGFAWESGFRVNELIVDTVKYDMLYTFKGGVSDNIRADIIYNEDLDQYEYEFYIVFRELGKYVFHSVDYVLATIGEDEEYQSMIQDIDFEGKCRLNLSVYNVITHEGHYHDFKEELIYLDTAVYRNKLTSLDPTLELGAGVSNALENNGFFCFEVVE